MPAPPPSSLSLAPSLYRLTPVCHGDISRCPGCRRPERVGEYTEAVACGFCEARLVRDLRAEDGEYGEEPPGWTEPDPYDAEPGEDWRERPAPTWPPEDDLPPEKEPAPVEPEPEPQPDDADSYAAPEGAWPELWTWLDQVRGGL